MNPEAERVLAQAAVQQEMYRTEQALMAALRNYPIAWLGKAWLWMLFPLGGKHQPVSDKVLHSLTREAMQNGEMRQVLKQGVFVPQADDEALAQLEQALVQTLACEPLVKTLKDKYGRVSVKVGAIAGTLQQALKDSVISQAEYQQLQTWLELRRQVIAVDDFTPEEITS
ncbi:MAG: DUF1974 domain-containing protein [Ghiorsea sp.]|nr:DUF1974 domain-containing protein [Ghiorsea sp.]